MLPSDWPDVPPFVQTIGPEEVLASNVARQEAHGDLGKCAN